MIDRGQAAGARALNNLVDWGFLVVTEGAIPTFNRTPKNKKRLIPNTKGKATTYSLTMFKNDFTGEPATNDWRLYETEPNDRIIRRDVDDAGSAPLHQATDIRVVVNNNRYTQPDKLLIKTAQSPHVETVRKASLFCGLGDSQSMDI